MIPKSLNAISVFGLVATFSAFASEHDIKSEGFSISSSKVYYTQSSDYRPFRPNTSLFDYRPSERFHLAWSPQREIGQATERKFADLPGGYALVSADGHRGFGSGFVIGNGYGGRVGGPYFEGDGFGGRMGDVVIGPGYGGSGGIPSTPEQGYGGGPEDSISGPGFGGGASGRIPRNLIPENQHAEEYLSLRDTIERLELKRESIEHELKAKRRRLHELTDRRGYRFHGRKYLIRQINELKAHNAELVTRISDARTALSRLPTPVGRYFDRAPSHSSSGPSGGYDGTNREGPSCQTSVEQSVRDWLNSLKPKDTNVLSELLTKKGFEDVQVLGYEEIQKSTDAFIGSFAKHTKRDELIVSIGGINSGFRQIYVLAPEGDGYSVSLRAGTQSSNYLGTPQACIRDQESGNFNLPSSLALSCSKEIQSAIKKWELTDGDEKQDLSGLQFALRQLSSSFKDANVYWGQTRLKYGSDSLKQMLKYSRLGDIVVQFNDLRNGNENGEIMILGKGPDGYQIIGGGGGGMFDPNTIVRHSCRDPERNWAQFFGEGMTPPVFDQSGPKLRHDESMTTYDVSAEPNGGSATGSSDRTSSAK